MAVNDQHGRPLQPSIRDDYEMISRKDVATLHDAMQALEDMISVATGGVCSGFDPLEEVAECRMLMSKASKAITRYRAKVMREQAKAAKS